ncbi:MAG: ComEC family competence protein [Rhodobacteraceae bacterium]|nr:MAG: ComEC family competence protein [Paracoccaceae bacterium]
MVKPRNDGVARRSRYGAAVAGGARRGAAWEGRLDGSAFKAWSATEAARRRLPLWAPVALGLGIQLWFWAPVEPPAWSMALAPLALLTLWRTPGAATAALFCLALGFSAATARARLVAAPVLPSAMVATVEGRVLSVDQSRAGRPRLLLDRLHVYGLSAETTPARARVTLLSPRHGAGVSPGDRISVLAALSPPAGPAAPGAFDFRRAAWFARLGAIGLARSAPARLAPEAPTPAIRLAALRARIADGLRERMPGEAGAFAAAVAAGDRAELPAEAVQALRDSNLAHLLAISGLHMAMVSGLAFAVSRLLLAAIPGAAVRLPAKRLAAGAALAAGVAYLLISGASVATQRAFVMAATALVAVMIDRPAVTMRALAAAATVVLLSAPESLVGVGFQMSFAATLALVAAYESARARGWLAARDRRIAARLARYAVGVVATSAIAGLATAPFAAFHFNRLALWGLPANLAAVPAMGLWVAPALMAAAAAAPLGLEAPWLAAAAMGIEWILGVARFFGGLDGAARAIPVGPPAALGAIVAGGLSIALLTGRRRWLGAVVIVAGLVVWAAGARTPDAMVAAEGRIAAVATPLGLVPDHPTAAGYVGETWLRRAGDRADQRVAAARPAWRDDGPWRVAPFGDGAHLHITRERRLSAATLQARCGLMDVLVTPNATVLHAPSGGCLVFDRRDLSSGFVSLRVEVGLPVAERDASSRRFWGLRPVQ